MRKAIKIGIIGFGFLCGCMKLEDPKKISQAYQIRDMCLTEAEKKYPIKNVKLTKSQPVYETIVVGDPVCSTKTIRKPHVVAGQQKYFKDVVTCENKTLKQYSHTKVWEEIIDENKTKRMKQAQLCIQIRCEKNLPEEARKCENTAEI